MKVNNGPILTYELVYKFFWVEVHSLRSDGYHHLDGHERGCLVKSESMGRVMYHRPRELMRFKCEDAK